MSIRTTITAKCDEPGCKGRVEMVVCNEVHPEPTVGCMIRDLIKDGWVYTETATYCEKHNNE